MTEADKIRKSRDRSCAYAHAELASWEFVELADAEGRLRPAIWRRLQRAHDALLNGTTSYIERAG